MLIAATGTLRGTPEDPIVYQGEYPKILPAMARDGYHAVELHIEDSRRLDRARLWQLLKQNGLKLTSIGTGSVYFSRGYSLTVEDPAVRAACIDHLEQHMITAEPDHAVVIVGCLQGRIAPGQTKEHFYGLMEKSLHVLDELADKHGVRIGLELMNRFESDILNTIDKGSVFLDRCGFTNVVLHVDTVHMNIEEANIRSALLRGGERIGHVHVADNDRWYPGHAHYNFIETLEALKEIGYQGALALETNGYPDPETSARRGLEYLQDTIRHIEWAEW
jgi:sugar phosphate isomerase/epimerase